MVSAPVLKLRREKGHSTPGMNACDKQIGLFLMQEQLDGTKKPLGRGARALNAAEKSYDTTPQ